MLTTITLIGSLLAGSEWVCKHETRYMQYNLIESITARTRYDDEMRFHTASETVYRRMFNHPEIAYPSGELAAMAVVVEGQAKLHDDDRLEFRPKRARATPLFDRIGMLSPEMLRETEQLYLDRRRREDWPKVEIDGNEMSILHGQDGPTIRCTRYSEG